MQYLVKIAHLVRKIVFLAADSFDRNLIFKVLHIQRIVKAETCRCRFVLNVFRIFIKSFACHLSFKCRRREAKLPVPHLNLGVKYFIAKPDFISRPRNPVLLRHKTQHSVAVPTPAAAHRRMHSDAAFQFHVKLVKPRCRLTERNAGRAYHKLIPSRVGICRLFDSFRSGSQRFAAAQLKTAKEKIPD